MLESVTLYVEKKLKLKVNDHKSKVVPTSRCKFLGFSLQGKEIIWHLTALSKFKENIKRITKGSRGMSVAAVLKELVAYLRGWIRKRVRMHYWKQWRKLELEIY